MAFVGSPQRIQASVTICHYLHEEERSHPGRASGCEGRAPPPAADEPLHRCLQPGALSYFAGLFYFHLLRGINLDIYWPQTILMFL